MNLTKHHGLGNDFLVLVDLGGIQPADGDLARRLCHRTTGVGADGLIRASRGEDGGVRMELWNADGTSAELSGNGLRCLAQALVLGGAADPADPLTITTAAGPHRVEVRPTDDPSVHDIAAELGEVVVEGPAPDWLLPGVVDAAFARIENPHLVLLAPEPATAPDLEEVGVAANAEVEGGVNVEMIRIAPDEIVLDVFERGAGRTQACGTGACAAAAVAHGWGLVGDRVKVRMPGGTAAVILDGTATLAGPIHAVAEVVHPWP